MVVIKVAPTKIPRTGTSGYRNAKLETGHQQSFASCRSLSTPLQVAGSNMPILLVASTSSSANSRPKQKGLVSQLHKARDVSEFRVCIFFLLLRPHTAPIPA